MAGIIHLIITSRRLPEDLQDRQSKDIDKGIIRAEQIGGISDSDSIQLLKKLEMQDSEEDLEWIADRVKGNVLILRLLADYADRPGQLRKEPQLVTDKARPIVEVQWERQNAAARELLQRMCVLRIGMDEAALTTLRLLPAAEKMTLIHKAKKWLRRPQPDAEKKATNALLKELVNCGLVQESYDILGCKSLYVLHRLIAETLQAISQEKEKLQLLWQHAARLYASFDTNPQDFHSLEDWQFTLEKLHFSWLLRKYEEVVKIVVYSLLPQLGEWCYWDLQEEWCSRIKSHYSETDRRYCLDTLANIHRNRGDYTLAEASYQESLELSTKLDDRARIAYSKASLESIASKRGNWDEAEQLCQTSLEIYTELEDRTGIADSKASLGNIASNRGDYTLAEAFYQESLELYTELGNRSGIAGVWDSLGFIARDRGEYGKAKAFCKTSLALYTELGNRSGIAGVWNSLGYIARDRAEYDRAEYDRAEELYEKSLTLRTELGDRPGIAHLRGCLGDIARYRREYDKAEQLYHQYLNICTESRNRHGMAMAWGCLGMNELKRGKNLEAAEIWMKKALTELENLKMAWYIAEANGDLAQLYRAKGDEKQAQAYYSISHDLFTKIGAKKDLEKIEREWIVGVASQSENLTQT
jgi:tetratricopeptide (TPR) repeat protein